MTIAPEAKHKIEATLNSYPALRSLFGGVLCVRFSAVHSDCNLLRSLESARSSALEFWEERCELFLKVIENVAMASAKTEYSRVMSV